MSNFVPLEGKERLIAISFGGNQFSFEISSEEWTFTVTFKEGIIGGRCKMSLKQDLRGEIGALRKVKVKKGVYWSTTSGWIENGFGGFNLRDLQKMKMKVRGKGNCEKKGLEKRGARKRGSRERGSRERRREKGDSGKRGGKKGSRKRGWEGHEM